MLSLEHCICWRCAISSPLSMGCCFPARIAQSPCHHFRTIHQPHPYLVYHRHHKKLCWTSSPWPDRKVQAEERHTGAWFGNRWGLLRNQSPCSSWWMEKLSEWAQQLCLRWAWLPCAGLCWPNARLQTTCRPDKSIGGARTAVGRIDDSNFQMRRLSSRCIWCHDRIPAWHIDGSLLLQKILSRIDNN